MEECKHRYRAAMERINDGTYSVFDICTKCEKREGAHIVQTYGAAISYCGTLNKHHDLMEEMEELERRYQERNRIREFNTLLIRAILNAASIIIYVAFLSRACSAIMLRGKYLEFINVLISGAAFIFFTCLYFRNMSKLEDMVHMSRATAEDAEPIEKLTPDKFFDEMYTPPASALRKVLGVFQKGS